MSQIVIKTERLLLRPLRLADSQTLFKIFSHPEVMKHWSRPAWQSLDDARDFISRSADAMSRGESVTFGIELTDSHELAGKCMLFNIVSGSERAEMGFGIGRDYWGKGIGFEAGHALLTHAFENLRLRRIGAEIDPENKSSAKLLERLGFVREGLLRERWKINDVISDSALYGRLSKDL